jgi:hypothetical protein
MTKMRHALQGPRSNDGVAGPEAGRQLLHERVVDVDIRERPAESSGGEFLPRSNAWLCMHSSTLPKARKLSKWKFKEQRDDRWRCAPAASSIRFSRPVAYI